MSLVYKFISLFTIHILLRNFLLYCLSDVGLNKKNLNCRLLNQNHQQTQINNNCRTCYHETGFILVLLTPRIKGYEGHFTQGLMDGPGTMYYEKTGNVLFRGQFKSGNFYNGTLFAEDGTKLKDVVPSVDKNSAVSSNSTPPSIDIDEDMTPPTTMSNDVSLSVVSSQT